MATIALPINQLGAVLAEAERAEADTRCVVSFSESAAATVGTSLRLFRKTISVRHRLSHIVEKQNLVLGDLVERNFSYSAPEDLLTLAGRIDDLIQLEREMLKDASTLGVPIRVWWADSLSKIADQVEHFDSLSESLHAAADPQSTALMGLAVERLSALCEAVSR